MSFNFDTRGDEELFMQSCGLIKNEGFFKSAKQAAFLSRGHKFAAEAFSLHGVPVKVGQRVATVHASTRWADYGARSVIPMMFIFVYDEFGVVARFKVPYKGNLRVGAYPDDSRTQVQWVRSADAVVPEYLKPAEPTEAAPIVSVSQYILEGQSGTRIKLTGVVKSIRQFTGASMHYYDNGLRTVTTVDCGGNIVTYFNSLADAKVGDEVEFVATIKGWSEYNGVKQTTVGRASKIKIIEKV